jgi:hypothetical protein
MTHLDTPQSIGRLGVARCDVTPPVGIYHRTWGAATHDRSTGVHRPLTATALAFQIEGHGTGPAMEQIVVALDHCLLWAHEMETLIAAVCQETQFQPEQVAIAFSHTHGAGLLGRDRRDRPGGELIPAYLDELAKRVASLVAQARRNRELATLTYATGHCALAANRDFWDPASKQWVCGFNPSGVADDSVLVVRATGAQGQPLATVVNYACHPTTLAWENTLISPDFVGPMREVVESATGVPCAFLQGASGDIGPREGFVGDPAVADRNGRQLGYAALAALESLPPPRTRYHYTGPVVSGATLGTWAHRPLAAASLQKKADGRIRHFTVTLDYRLELLTLEQAQADRARWLAEEQKAQQSGDTTRARDCHAMVERMDRWIGRLGMLPEGPRFALPVTLMHLGDAVWVLVEAEHYNILQRSLRERFPETPIIVATLVNGSRVTYLPPAELYGTGIYQESIAILAAGSLERVIDEIGKAIREGLAGT